MIRLAILGVGLVAMLFLFRSGVGIWQRAFGPDDEEVAIERALFVDEIANEIITIARQQGLFISRGQIYELAMLAAATGAEASAVLAWQDKLNRTVPGSGWR